MTLNINLSTPETLALVGAGVALVWHKRDPIRRWLTSQPVFTHGDRENVRDEPGIRTPVTRAVASAP